MKSLAGLRCDQVRASMSKRQTAIASSRRAGPKPPIMYSACRRSGVGDEREQTRGATIALTHAFVSDELVVKGRRRRAAARRLDLGDDAGGRIKDREHEPRRAAQAALEERVVCRRAHAVRRRATGDVDEAVDDGARGADAVAHA